MCSAIVFRGEPGCGCGTYQPNRAPIMAPAFTPAGLVLDEFLAALRERCASERIGYLASDEAQEED